MKSSKLFFFLLFLMLCLGLSGQDLTIFAQPGDEVQITLDEMPQGTSFHWESSPDEQSWSDLSGETNSILNTTVSQLPVYFRATVQGPDCELFSDVVAVIDQVTQAELWSDPDTWESGEVPVAGEVVMIPEGKSVLLDVDTEALGGLTVNGYLSFDRSDLHLTTEWLMVAGGILEIGTELNPFEQKAIITLNDSDMDEDIMNMGTRGLVVMNNGRLELHGAVPDVVITKLNADLDPSQSPSTLTLKDVVRWELNDEIVIGPTDFYEAGGGTSITRKLTLEDGVNGTGVPFNETIDAYYWGRLQYVTEAGLSLDPASVLVTPPAEDTDERQTPRILDERAPVGHLTRNIVIEGPDDAAWNDHGFGAHTMIMPSGVAHVEGVEFRRVGQRGRERRYPWHWHMLSYSGSETLEDATGQYLRNSSVSHSKNRGIVVHGTNGVEVSNNVVYDIEGHGIFTEDAIERRNVIDGNLVLHVRNQPGASALLEHEANRSSGFWISNPDNIITNNHAADCRSFGFWMTFPEHPLRLGSEVLNEFGELMRPNRIALHTFDGNTAHSNGENGIMLDVVEINDEGQTQPLHYMATTTQEQWPPFPYYTTGRVRFTLSNYTVFKSLGNGIWDRAYASTNYGAVSADNCGRYFAGSGDDGIIERTLVVGTSFNHLMNGTDRPAFADFSGGAGYSTSYPAAFATYHSTFEIRDNIGVNFPLIEGERSGFFATDDFYTIPVEKGTIRNTNNLMINSHPGVRLRAAQSQFTLAGALHDPNGIWGPDGSWIVYDVPFLTHDYTTSVIEPGAGAGGVSVEGNFYGGLAFLKDNPDGNPFNQFMEVQVYRYDVEAGLDLNSPVGDWNVPYGITETSALLGNMRHFAARPASDQAAYVLSFPDTNGDPNDGENEYSSTYFQMSLNNMLEASDQMIVGVKWDGSVTAIEVFAWMNDQNETRENYTEVFTFDEVRGSDGATWYQDEVNNIVWAKIRGGIWEWQLGEWGDPEFNDLLYEQFEFVIQPSN